MISVYADVATQRLDLKVKQAVTEADLQKLLADVKSEIAKLRPGWVMAGDYRGLKVVDPKLNSYIGEIQKAVAAGKPRKIASLFDSVIFRMQLQMNPNANAYKDITKRFDNEQEWAAYLAQPQ